MEPPMDLPEEPHDERTCFIRHFAGQYVRVLIKTAPASKSIREVAALAVDYAEAIWNEVERRKEPAQ